MRTVFIIIPIFTLVLAIFFLASGKRWISPDNIYIFENVKGPLQVSEIHVNKATPWQKYKNGGNSRLAVLLTDEKSSWLGLVHGLKTIGVPFLVTKDIEQALQHRVMIVYPGISGRLLPKDSLRKLANYAREGGILVGINVLGGGLNRVFGFEDIIASRQHNLVHLTKLQTLVDESTFPGKSIHLANPDITESILGTHSYSKPKHPPIGVYEDGSAAIIFNSFENGNVYAIGFDIGFYILKGYNRRLEGVASTYANGFEPSIDVILTLIKNIYKRGNPEAFTLGTVPYNKSFSLIFTHDIDYSDSLVNAVQYARLEKKKNAGGTHFIQTKYIKDWNDEIFFNKESLVYLRKLKSTGVELASHSVSHSLAFAQFPVGSGDEFYPSYRPFVKDRNASFNGTILGELRVSKFLIEFFLPETTVISFRPGYLANPVVLPQLLEATGYKYSSSVTANVSMTHLPFQLNYNRDIYSEIDIYEFPITVEDELPPKMGSRLHDAVKLAEEIGRYGGIYIVLIHPDILGHKFNFQKGLIEAVRDDAWSGTLADFGNWWSARDKVELDVTVAGQIYHVRLVLPEEIEGLTLERPEGLDLIDSTANLPIEQVGDKIIIKQARGELLFSFKKTADSNSDK